MTPTLSWTTLASLTVLLLLGQAAGQDLSLVNNSCLPDTPPNVDNGTVVLLQRNRWFLLENITQPDWNPDIAHDIKYFEYLQPGVMMTRRVQLIMPNRSIVNISYVSDGDTLCLAAPTQYGNASTNESGGSLTEVCTRICHKNFTTYGTRADLPQLVWDDWTRLRRTSQFMAFESVDPKTQPISNCMGHFMYRDISDLPRLFTNEVQCSTNYDECLFSHNGRLGLVDAGCRSNFAQSLQCVSNLTDCNKAEVCTVCCRGDNCNRAVAMQFYQNWLSETTTKISPTVMSTTTKRAGFARVPSLWALTAWPLASLLSWLLLMLR